MKATQTKTSPKSKSVPVSVSVSVSVNCVCELFLLQDKVQVVKDSQIQELQERGDGPNNFLCIQKFV